MRCVIQRVSRATVLVGPKVVGEIGRGLLVLAGCEKGDTRAVFEWYARKIADLRLFPNEDGEAGRHFELSVRDIGGAVLLVSQFTLLGDAKKGRRPSFSDAMPVAEAEKAFADFVNAMRATEVPVETGVFQAMMKVELVNDGPVTLIL